VVARSLEGGILSRSEMAWKVCDMTPEYSPHSALPPPSPIFESLECRTVASDERELIRHRFTEYQLRQALAREEVLLAQKDELIRQKDVLSQESDHRLLNGLQMIACAKIRARSASPSPRACSPPWVGWARSTVTSRSARARISWLLSLPWARNSAASR
jgi:hypothetical protein